MTDLRSFMAELESDPEEEVVRIEREVSPVHELSAVVKLLETRGNPTVVFEHVTGSELPVVAGLFGTKRRVALAIGEEPASCVARFGARISAPIPPRRLETGPVKDEKLVGHWVDLGALPIPVHSRGDAGPYLTAGVTIVRDPETGNVNLGMYRSMLLDARHITLNASLPHDLAKVMARGAERGEPVEFAIAIGYHPALAVASQAKQSMTLDSYGVTGALLGEPLEVVPGETVDLDVPAHAEIVVEGRVLPGERRPEGPFGEFTYYYGAASGWVSEITAITRRQDAIYLDIHPTHSEHRCLWLFPGREARLLERLREAIPTVQAVHIPLHGGGMSAYISLAKTHDGDAVRTLLIALSSDNYIKHAYVVDPDIDIFDPEHVLWAMNVRFQGDRDLTVVEKARGIRMDPSAYSIADRNTPGALTTKLGFDATVPLDFRSEERADLLPDAYADIRLDEYLARSEE